MSNVRRGRDARRRRQLRAALNRVLRAVGVAGFLTAGGIKP